MLNRRICFLMLPFISSLGMAVDIDLKKFEKQAKKACFQALSENQLQDGGEILFRDGAGAIGSEPVFDYGAYYYLPRLKPGTLFNDQWKLAYRQQLNGEKPEFMILVDLEKNDFTDAFAQSGIATFNDGVTTKTIETLMKTIKSAAPGLELTLLENIGVLTFKSPLRDSKKVWELLNKSRDVLAVELNHEAYPETFIFDKAIRITTRGKIDADKYRGVTKELRDQGVVFNTETTVPKNLQ